MTEITKTGRTKILDIPFDQVTMENAINLVINRLIKTDRQENKPLFIATPNPEMLLEANANPHFKKILQITDLNIADGFGIILASKLTKNPLKSRVTSIDLLQKICEQAPAGTKIFLLGAMPGIAEKTAKILKQQSPQIKIAGTYSGSPSESEEILIRGLINKSGAEILFVAFGSPKQELWLDRNLAGLNQLKIAIGVGGAFDFVSGNRQRAPRWMRKIGLEWLFRVIIEPARLGRIFNATIKFPLVFLKRQLIKTHKSK